MVAENAEVAQAFQPRLLDGYRGGRRGRLESDGKEHDLQFGVLPGDPECVLRLIDHTYVGAFGLGSHQAPAIAGRHPQHVAVGTQRDAVLQGQLNRIVDTSDR